MSDDEIREVKISADELRDILANLEGLSRDINKCINGKPSDDEPKIKREISEKCKALCGRAYAIVGQIRLTIELHCL